MKQSSKSAGELGRVAPGGVSLVGALSQVTIDAVMAPTSVSCLLPALNTWCRSIGYLCSLKI
jgi:hypothetical protein